jgi:hypothetical protein
MQAQDIAAIVAAVTTVVGSFAMAVRWLVKHYLAELKPNGGGSMNDRMSRLEARVETIIVLLDR